MKRARTRIVGVLTAALLVALPAAALGAKPTSSAITFQTASVSVTEDQDAVQLRLQRTGDISAVASVDCVTVDNATPGTGDATAGSDYQAGGYTAYFAAGIKFAACDIPVTDDTTDEVPERLTVQLSNAAGGSVAKKTLAVVTIIDDDLAGTLSVSDATVSEGSGTAKADFTVTLTPGGGGFNAPVTFSWKTANDDLGAHPASGAASCGVGVDYRNQGPTTVTLTPASPTAHLLVPICGDAVDEFAETFLVQLSSPTNAEILDGEGVGTINDNDPAPVLSIDDPATTWESDGPIVFTVTLTGATEKTVTVDFATNNVTAGLTGACTADGVGDVVAQSGTLTFAPGVTSQTVSVDVCEDAVAEPNETFTVDLSNASAATIGDAQGVGTIKDNDAATTDVSVVPAGAQPMGTMRNGHVIVRNTAGDPIPFVDVITELLLDTDNNGSVNRVDGGIVNTGPTGEFVGGSFTRSVTGTEYYEACPAPTGAVFSSTELNCGQTYTDGDSNVTTGEDTVVSANPPAPWNYAQYSWT